MAGESVPSTEVTPPADDGWGWWQITAVVFVLGMLLSILHSISLLKQSARPGPDYWLNRLAQACAKGDAKGAERALLFWAKSLWGAEAPTSLLEIANRLDREEMAQLLRQVREAVRSESAVWNTYLCRQVLVAYLQRFSVQVKEAED